MFTFSRQMVHLRKRHGMHMLARCRCPHNESSLFRLACRKAPQVRVVYSSARRWMARTRFATRGVYACPSLRPNNTKRNDSSSIHKWTAHSAWVSELPRVPFPLPSNDTRADDAGQRQGRKARTRLAKRLLRSQRRASPLLGGLLAKLGLARPRRNSARCCSATEALALREPVLGSRTCWDPAAEAGAVPAALRVRSCSLKSTSRLRAAGAHVN